MRRLLISALLLLLLLAQPPAFTTAAPAGLAMEVEAAFGGRFKYGEWLPVFVTVENPGPDLRADIRVTVTNQSGQLFFETPAELPAGARKRLTVYVLPNNFSRTLQAELVQAEKVLFSQKVNLVVLPNDRYVIGMAAGHTAGLLAMNPPQLPGRRERTELVSVLPDNLPDRPEGLRLLNALVLNDVDTGRFSPAQRQALHGWVSGGGRLILGGGAGAGRTLAGLPAELQPVTLLGQQNTPELLVLQNYTGEPVRVPGPFLLANVRPNPTAKVLLSQESDGGKQPLIVEQALGAGFVDFVALDLSGSPFDAWSGTPLFARQLLAPGAAWPDYLPADIAPVQMSDSQMTYALSNLPALDLPSIRLLGLLLVGYIILVGPANYLLLRRLDRMAWAWLTIPVLTLVFSGLAYGLSLGLRGSDIIINQISVMEMGQDTQISKARTYVGVFSPRRQAYDIEVSGQTLIRPLGEGYDPWSGAALPSVAGSQMGIIQGEPARVRGLAVNQWSMQSFVAETIPGEAAGLSARLTPARDSIQGRLDNQGRQTWYDVIILFNGQFQKLGDLAPGQGADIRLDFSRNQDNLIGGFGSYILFQDEFNRPGGAGREISFKQNVLDSAVFNNNMAYGQSNSPLLLAWLKDSPLQVSLQGQEVSTQKTTLLFGRLPLTFEGAYVGIPPGLSQAETISTTGDAGMCNYGPGVVGYHLYQGVIETRLTLPETVHNVQPEQLDLYIRTDGGWPALPAVELYDRVDDKWVLLAEARPGLNRIQDTRRFYDTRNASLQLRISSALPGKGGGCLFFDLALEGNRL